MEFERRITKNPKEIIPGLNSKKYLILHDTGSPGNSTGPNILKFFQKNDYLSIHLIMGLDGKVIQYVDFDDIAFHAGVSRWKDDKDLNRCAIGMEVVSDGKVFNDLQRDGTVDVFRFLMKKFNIPSERVLPHSAVAWPRGRKVDIGQNFYVPRWGSWEGFQKELDKENMSFVSFKKEIEDSLKFIKEKGIAEEGFTQSMVSRQDVFLMLKRMYDLLKK